MRSTYLKYDPVWHPVKNVKLFFRHRKWARQRVRKGYSESDVWDIDVWFYGVVPDMLLDFKKSCEGFPSSFISEYYEEHKEEIGLTYEEFMSMMPSPAGEDWYSRMQTECRKKWLDIIDEMRFLILESDEDLCSKQNPYRPGDDKYIETANQLADYRTECRKKAFSLLGEWLECLWT